MFYLNKIFKPKKKISLQRMGDKYDGGYLLNLKNINDATTFYSFGIGLSWEFENEIYNSKKRRNEPFKIYMFDHSISNYFWYKNTIISFVDLFRFKKRFFTYVYKFFKLKKFIRNKECNLMNYMISPVSLEHASIYKLKVTDLDQIFKKKDKVRNNFIKIDIEGSEYRILDQLLSYQKYLTGCIIEFHDIDLHIEKIKKFIEDFELNLIHCHVNNCGPIKDDMYPTQLEITFSYTNDDNKNEQSQNFNLPHSLDMPNHPQLRDDKIIFF
jgi:hypothetical protein